MVLFGEEFLAHLLVIWGIRLQGFIMSFLLEINQLFAMKLLQMI